MVDIYKNMKIRRKWQGEYIKYIKYVLQLVLSALRCFTALYMVIYTIYSSIDL